MEIYNYNVKYIKIKGTKPNIRYCFRFNVNLSSKLIKNKTNQMCNKDNMQIKRH